MVCLKSSLVEILMILVLWFSVLSKYGAEKNYTKVSEKEDMEIKRQLKILNKPPMKKIITKLGDTIDCIDVYKQPAFDHPLLKDHKIQVLNLPIHNDIGTVPIRRTTKRELMFSSLIKRRRKAYPRNPMYHHYVSVETPYNEKNEYYGAKASFGIHNPHVTQNQFSTSQLWIQNGPRDATNSIETGWAVSTY
ncbi:hypothetical protein C5167_044328 [Papaver somniferum]|uniref:Neprosin PEP catalytic domain-containing protein n=1 Tax=Papaver somniferum TaxID=3469 RepID=A0A4Y7LAR7_PAPSO|nr:hypothetical protein C5167_044328 [Papaver somniferum]